MATLLHSLLFDMQPGQDIVPRSGKMVFFKRAGQRVIINQFGDMLVRPPPIEASMRQVPGGES